MDFDSPLWDQTKISMVLQNSEASNQIEWGKSYATDDYAFDDIEFKTTINVDQNDEDKVILIEKNTTEQTVIVTVKDSDNNKISELHANSRRLENIRNNSLTVAPGESAVIEIKKSSPSVLFSG